MFQLRDHINHHITSVWFFWL